MDRAPARLIEWLTWISVGAFAVLWAARWSSFPLLLDPTYHLMIAQELVQAGGPFGYEWWQFAPVGRPHLYPPVLHLCLAGLLKLGCAPIAAIRIASVAVLPLLAVSVVMVMRRIATRELALACVWILMLPFAFHLHATIALAATLGLIEIVWLIAALELKRPLAAGGVMVLLAYTHLGLPVVALVLVGLMAWWRAELRTTIAKASGMLVAAVPWWWHLWVHRASFHVFSRQENTMVELMPAVVGMAAVGAWQCWRQRGVGWWWLALAAGFVIFAPIYPYRWLSGEGMLAIVLLAGSGLVWVGRAVAKGFRAADRSIAAMGLVFLLLMVTPTVTRNTAGWQWWWPDSGPWHLIAPPTPAFMRRDLEGYVYSPPIQQLAAKVAALARADEILWVNAAYGGGLVAVLTGRATSSAMLDEIPPAHPFDALAAAHVVVWLKILPLPGMPTLAQVLQRYPLQRISEDAFAVILRNPLAHQPQAVISFGLAFVLLCGVIGVVVWDLFR